VDQPPKGVIYVFQQYNKSIFPWRTVLENVGFGLEHQDGLSRASRREQCQEYIRLVGLEGYESYYPSQLSGGMQQRVAIARALVGEAPIIMADEPTGNLDSKTSYEVMAILQNLVEQGKTVILVTHEHDIALYAARVVTLRDGRIIDDRTQTPQRADASLELGSVREAS
jgi:ABC-type lipoprotein export system ATPase subunit